MSEMSVSRAVRARRAVKAFEPHHTMSEGEFRWLMEHALLSPTAFNLQHWRFVRVSDPALRRAIRAVGWDQPQITDASLLLIVCFDKAAWRKGPDRYWRQVADPTRSFILENLDRYYRGREQVQHDEGMRSCGLVAMSLMLLAQEMGYDSCPMDGFDFDAVARLIGLPADHAIALMLAIGKRRAEPFPRGGQLPAQEVVIENRFA